MPFTPHLIADFRAQALAFIRTTEQFTGSYDPLVHQPGDHVPTIGYGYAMVVLAVGSST
ncbi:MAG TPA: hypothetical protein VFA81_00600 [Burkholderiales bacterium]|nr:hypothetical protein [Burkholderiales bacterium]